MDLGVVLPESRVADMRTRGLWPDRLLLEYLAEAVAKSPDKIAITAYDSISTTADPEGGVSRLTYGDLDRLSKRWALAMLDLGLKPGDVVALQLPNWWQYTVMHLACLRIGAITNPLMPIFRERELLFMLGFAEAKLIVAPHHFRGFDYAPMVDGMRPELPHLAHAFFIGAGGDDSFEDMFTASPREQAPDADQRLAGLQAGPNDVNEIMYTSGTTGQPKGVMHTANTQIGALLPVIQRFGFTADSVALMSSPLAHQTGFLYGMMVPIILGAHSVLQDRWEPLKACWIIEREKATYTMASTPFLNDLAGVETVHNGEEDTGFNVSTLKLFIAAGAPIPRALVRNAEERLQLRVVSGWGMTECGLSTSCRFEDAPEKIFETDGSPVPGNEVIVHDDDGKPVPNGVEGDLKTRGVNLFVGYLKRPDAYVQDADGWFETGDRAIMDDDGFIRISGRSKDIIIRGGENIPIVEVENVIFSHPAVEDVAIVGAPDVRLGERACAYVTLIDGAELSFDDLKKFLDAKNMAQQYYPEYLEVLETFPRTPSGKIQKFHLREWAKKVQFT